MNRLELLYGYQKTESGLKVYADMHHVNQNVKGGFELSFYGGLKMHDLGGLRINRC